MKKLSAILSLVLVLTMCFTLTAFAEPEVYTVDFDSLTEWDYCFVAVNSFGDEAGVGMVNLDNWGMKKLQLDADGNLAGAGLSYTLNLTVDGDITCSEEQKAMDSMSVPESGFSVDSEGNGEDGIKIIGSKLIDTVFGGATFYVSDGVIESIDDIEWL